MAGSEALRVLTFTTLYPSAAAPFHGTFVRSRVERLARLCSLEVAAPVNATRPPALHGKVPREEILGGVRVSHPSFAVLPGILKHLDGWLIERQVAPQLKPLRERLQPEVLDVHYAFPDGHAGMLLARRWGIPFVLSLRGSDVKILPRFPRRRKVIEEVLRAASGIVAVSDDLRREAVALGARGERIRVIPNGIDLGRFAPRRREEARQALGVPPEALAIISVGRLAAVKGAELLLEAAAILKPRLGRPLRVYLAGDGERKKALQAEAARRGLGEEIVFLGWTEPDRLPLWYSAADIFCLLSESEGCPNALLEALACGTPAVATAVGGVPEVIREGVDGLLVAARSADAVAARIEEAARTAWNREEIPKNPFIRDWSVVAREQYDFLRSVVEGHRCSAAKGER